MVADVESGFCQQASHGLHAKGHVNGCAMGFSVLELALFSSFLKRAPKPLRGFPRRAPSNFKKRFWVAYLGTGILE